MTIKCWFSLQVFTEQTEYLWVFLHIYVCVQTAAGEQSVLLNTVKSHFEKKLSIKQVFP